MTPRKALEKILDTFFPPTCIFCNAPAFEADFCGDCERNLKPVTPLLGAAYKELSVFEYNATTMRAVKSLKYHGKTQIAKAIAKIIAQKYAEELKGAAVLCTVPTHGLKLAFRRYNQAAEIGRHLSKILGVAFQPRLLKRRKFSNSQTSLKRHERLKNLENAFVLNPRLKKKIAGKTVIIVDDVITTGATITACKRQLEGALPLGIYAVSFVKTPLSSE